MGAAGAGTVGATASAMVCGAFWGTKTSEMDCCSPCWLPPVPVSSGEPSSLVSPMSSSARTAMPWCCLASLRKGFASPPPTTAPRSCLSASRSVASASITLFLAYLSREALSSWVSRLYTAFIVWPMSWSMSSPAMPSPTLAPSPPAAPPGPAAGAMSACAAAILS